MLGLHPDDAANASYTWYPPTTAGWDTVRGMYGSAMVTSDQPVAVIVNDASEAGAALPQDSQIYNGVPPTAIVGPTLRLDP